MGTVLTVHRSRDSKGRSGADIVWYGVMVVAYLAEVRFLHEATTICIMGWLIAFFGHDMVSHFFRVKLLGSREPKMLGGLVLHQ